MSMYTNFQKLHLTVQGDTNKFSDNWKAASSTGICRILFGGYNMAMFSGYEEEGYRMTRGSRKHDRERSLLVTYGAGAQWVLVCQIIKGDQAGCAGMIHIYYILCSNSDSIMRRRT